MKGEVLLLQRDEFGTNKQGERFEIPYPGFWAAPSGGVKIFETAERAAVRELSEETGLYVPNGLSWHSTNRNPKNNADDYVFTAIINADEFDVMLGEGRNYGFFSRDQICNDMNVVPYIKTIIEWLDIQTWRPLPRSDISGGLFTIRAPQLLQR